MTKTATTDFAVIPPPETIARLSPRVRRAHRFIRDVIGKIEDRELARNVSALLGLLRQQQGETLLRGNRRACAMMPRTISLLEAKLPYIPWWAAPAAGLRSHHPYPGGWLIHNATNLSTLEGLMATAASVRGRTLPADILLAGMLLHDWAKPRMFVWHGRELDEDQGEAGHHVAALAEAVLRGFPPEVIVMLAGVHCGWWEAPGKVAAFLEQTGELLDAPEISAWAKNTEPCRSVAGWVMRQGESAWYTASRNACQDIIEPLRIWIAGNFPESDGRGIEHLVLGWADELELCEIHARGGMEALGVRAWEALEEARTALLPRHR